MDVLARRRLAMFALFFVPGIGLSSWVTRTPAVRDALEASTAQMGLVLFGLSIGSMTGILASGPLVARFSTRPVILAGMSSIVASLLVIGLGVSATSALLVAVGLGLFGLGMGGAEIAMNVEGADVEKKLARPVLPAIHGFFSVGTVVGAVAGMAAEAARFPVALHLAVAAAVAVVAVAVALPQIASGVGVSRKPTPEEIGGVRPRSLWREPQLLLIGVVVLAMAFAEGAANDWLPLLMVDGHGFAPALGSAVYAVFAAAMAIGRFSGAPLLRRFGRGAVLRASAVSGGVGLALVIFVDSQPVAAAAVLLWGLGASLGFPVAVSAASDSGEDGPARVALVATVAYLAFLVGPPVLGLLGEELGLRYAMLVVLLLVVVAAVVAPAAARSRSAHDPRPAGDPAGADEPAVG